LDSQNQQREDCPARQSRQICRSIPIQRGSQIDQGRFLSTQATIDKKFIFITIPLFLCPILLAVAIPGLYVSQEKFFYYWDYGGVQGIAIHQAQDFFKYR